MNSFNYEDHDTELPTKQQHECHRLAAGDVRLTDEEMSEAIDLRREIHQLVDHAADLQRISEYMAGRLNRVHAQQSALLHRIKERECIQAVDIAIDENFKVVKAGV